MSIRSNFLFTQPSFGKPRPSAPNFQILDISISFGDVLAQSGKGVQNRAKFSEMHESL